MTNPEYHVLHQQTMPLDFWSLSILMWHDTNRRFYLVKITADNFKSSLGFVCQSIYHLSLSNIDGWTWWSWLKQYLLCCPGRNSFHRILHQNASLSHDWTPSFEIQHPSSFETGTVMYDNGATRSACPSFCSCASWWNFVYNPRSFGVAGLDRAFSLKPHPILVRVWGWRIISGLGHILMWHGTNRWFI